MAVHPGTNKIYVSHTDPSQPSVTVVDGVTNAVIGTIDYPEGYDLWSLSIDQSTNLLYVVEREAGLARRRLLSFIDMATDTIVGSELLAATQYNLGVEVAVNQNTHRAYTPGDCLSNVSVVYGGELLKNPSFEGVDQSGQPRSWRMRDLGIEDGTEVITCSTVNDLVFEGARSLRLAGAAEVEKEVYQNIAVTGPAGTVISLEGFSRSTDASPSGGRYQIRARVSFTDSSTDTFDVRFAKGTHPWRRGFQAYTAPKAFDRVRVSVLYENQTGTAWFDAVHLWTTGP